MARQMNVHRPDTAYLRKKGGGSASWFGGNEIIMRELMSHVYTFVCIWAKTGDYLAFFLAFVDL
jgi:hypothetical protein